MEKKLIEAVRGRTVLYDTSDANYLKIKLKLLIWKEIAQEIGMKSGSEAKTLWEKLRHSLRDAIRRQKKCVGNGAAGTTPKPWKFQKEMRFLQPYMANRKRETSLVHESDEDSNTQDQEELESEKDSKSEEPGDKDTTKTQSKETSLDPLASSRKKTSIPRKKIKRTDNRAKVRPILLKSIEHREKRATERAVLERVQPQSDPLYHFFMSMYESTKRMPPSSQLVMKNQIFDAVTDMEADLLNNS